ncbi:penicillin-binding protein 2 (pbp-2) [hydrocarbon metagenome]|uniref:Penicillin-binding protein 2 (Pbp-2) n=1 Tax=hydrocarbon metagenome TaxID=938273 RepID=A0A0W8G627_9ZZZZ
MRFESETQHAPRSGLILLQVMVFGLFCLFTLRFWYLQVHKGEQFAQKALDNQMRQVLIDSARGRVWDRGGRPVAVSEPSFALGLVREDCEDVEATLAKVAQWTGADPAALMEIYKRGKKRVKPFEPLILVTDLSYEALAHIEANDIFWPGLEIVVRQKRHYPEGPLMAHILGYVAEANEEELEKNQALSLGDSVGKQGLELTREDWLRGAKGKKQVEVDALGRQHNEKVLTEPRAGNNIALSIDLDLQRLATGLLEGQAGAIVVLDPDSGKLLALVSQPAYDNNLFVLGVPQDKWAELRDDPMHPIQNRTTQGLYPPGSVFKLLVAAAGLSEGFTTYADGVVCTGSYQLGNRKFHCWKKGGHGYVDLRRALVHSCDVYFYKLGERMGMDRINAYAKASGFGVTTGVDLPHEKAGLIPSREWKKKRFGEAWTRGETLNASIGQGYVLVSPLQVARYVGALLNGGKLIKPSLLLDEPPEIQGVLPLSDEHRRFLVETMVDTVQGGTARRLLRPDARMGGKTGTAQVVKLINPDQRRKTADMPYKYRDHAWLASFGEKDGKRYVVIVLVEHGGHGGEVAGPMAKAVFEHILGPTPGKAAVQADPVVNQLEAGD